MVLITIPKAVVLLAAIVVPATMVAAQGYYSVDDLALRGLSLDDDLDFAARGYDDDSLSVREYIDTQIELALRDYQDSFEELFARHTKEEIASKIAEYKRKLAQAEPLLKPAVNRRKAAEKAYRAKTTDAALKKAYETAKTAENTIRDSVEGHRENLEFWQSQQPSRSPSPAGKGKGKK
ncbi:hypothetical protein FA13DRAFT_1817996 [Coprinellus micaceus]|uniref:Uncharacterized protein n=1 Tax=Coprinellus micaceus TaxID=71717 RepID=A0A4Y7SPI6_COPMI|nr:hypothetical protein FA13DRAFT_1818346 [Coprinellus micaceus]TEB24273.1 hypothetical protein FA13DRAFT_1817996 [Coprinellus micaceus]